MKGEHTTVTVVTKSTAQTVDTVYYTLYTLYRVHCGTNSGRAVGFVWKNLPLGYPEQTQTDYPRDPRGKIFRQSLRLFHCKSDVGLHKTKRLCPAGAV